MLDVVIVGGGPAGASLAALLAGEGWSVALLDRARFPRDKACGEFLTPQAARLLRQLGVWNDLRAQGLRDVNATVLVAPDGRQVEHAPLDGEPAGYALRRVVLDAALLLRARNQGAIVEEGFAVRELCRSETGQVNGVTGRDSGGETRTLHARVVVGADGAHSLVARQLNLVKPIPRLQRIALVAHWQGNIGGRRDTIEMRTHGSLVCGLGFPGGANTNFCCAEPLRSTACRTRRGVDRADTDQSLSRPGRAPVIRRWAAGTRRGLFRASLPLTRCRWRPACGGCGYLY